MQFLVLSALLLPIISAATPITTTENLEARAQKAHWNLYELKLWTADSSTPGASYIDFLFQDDNSKASRVDTDCYRAAIPGNRRTGINDPENFYPCADPRVTFKYNKGLLQIAYTYKDPSVGKPDEVTAFGNKTLTFKNDKQTCGTLGTRNEATVPITALIA